MAVIPRTRFPRIIINTMLHERSALEEQKEDFITHSEELLYWHQQLLAMLNDAAIDMKNYSFSTIIDVKHQIETIERMFRVFDNVRDNIDCDFDALNRYWKPNRSRKKTLGCFPTIRTLQILNCVYDHNLITFRCPSYFSWQNS